MIPAKKSLYRTDIVVKIPSVGIDSSKLKVDKGNFCLKDVLNLKCVLFMIKKRVRITKNGL